MPQCSDIRFSSGYSCMTEEIQGIFFTESHSIYLHTIVLFVPPTLKKLPCICYGTITLPSPAGTPFWVIDTENIFVYDEVLLLSQALPTPIAMEIIIMGCRNIWIKRNGKIFNSKLFSLHSWKYMLRKDLLLIKHKIKDKYEALLSSWIDQILDCN